MLFPYTCSSLSVCSDAICGLLIDFFNLLFNILQRFRPRYRGAIELWGLFTVHESTLTLKLGSQVLVRMSLLFAIPSAWQKNILFFFYEPRLSQTGIKPMTFHTKLQAKWREGGVNISTLKDALYHWWYTCTCNDFRSVLVSKRKNYVLSAISIIHDNFKITFWSGI